MGILKLIQKLGRGDGKEPQASWISEIVDFSDLSKGVDWQDADNAAGVAYVQYLIRREIDRGIAPDRVFVIYHSQGGCVGSRAMLTFPDAPLGGLVLLSAFHGSPDLAVVTADAQRSLKVLIAHSAGDKMVPIAAVQAQAEYIRAAVGETNVQGVIEEDDNPAELGFHMPFVPSVAQPLAEFLKQRE